MTGGTCPTEKAFAAASRPDLDHAIVRALVAEIGDVTAGPAVNTVTSVTGHNSKTTGISVQRHVLNVSTSSSDPSVAGHDEADRVLRRRRGRSGIAGTGPDPNSEDVAPGLTNLGNKVRQRTTIAAGLAPILRIVAERIDGTRGSRSGFDSTDIGHDVIGLAVHIATAELGHLVRDACRVDDQPLAPSTAQAVAGVNEAMHRIRTQRDAVTYRAIRAQIRSRYRSEGDALDAGVEQQLAVQTIGTISIGIREPAVGLQVRHDVAVDVDE